MVKMEALYTLEREVGRGSYGVVFEGHMAKTGQRVAIKRLPCNNPESIELYLKELWAMRATAKNHINVIALHGCLLQTGPRSLKNLKPGKLPVRLVESVMKGTVSRLAQTEERSASRSNCQRRNNTRSRLEDNTCVSQARPKLQDRTNSPISNTETPRTPQSRVGKRSAQREDEEEQQQVQQRCLALWLVMEYCDGGDLNQYLLSRPPDCQDNHTVVQQLSGAVAFLHGLGITHRDLKPDNVLVCLTREGPVVKVADFGLSKMSDGLMEGDQTRQHFSSTCGSDFYMAPEVWGGLMYTAQADIFSLGVMFWAVLERITFLEEGTTQEQLGWVMLGSMCLSCMHARTASGATGQPPRPTCSPSLSHYGNYLLSGAARCSADVIWHLSAGLCFVKTFHSDVVSQPMLPHIVHSCPVFPDAGVQKYEI